MRYIKLIVLSTVFSLSYGDIYKADTCNTPDGKDGECIHINKCRSLWPRAYQLELSNNFDFLRRSQCGNGQYMYCCPLKPKVECYTPDGRPGNCILYSTYIFQHEDTKFLMDSKCDTSELKFCYSALPRKVSNSNNCSQNDLVPDQNSNCCGIDASDANRIIGGSVARLGEYPWLALINYADTRELCAGVLISQLYVLTAAHCVNKDRENIPVSVVLGEHDRSTSIDCITFGNVQDCAEPTVTIMISHVTVHPEYNPSSSNKRNDIALIRLEDMAPYTEFIRPICLPLGLYDIHFSTQGRNKLWTAGWGNYDARHFRRSQVKLKVDLPYVDTAECANIYAESNFPITLWNKQVCAGGASGKDTCGGDSGGPLMMENESGKFELVGIVSFGMRMCGADRIPGVYTNVFKYMPWIRSVVRPYDKYD